MILGSLESPCKGLSDSMKKKNIKKTAPYDCSRYPKVHLYQFVGQLGHFPRRSSDFRRSFFFKFLPSQQKICVFFPKIGQFSTKNFKILGINKNHLNTSYVNFLGHFGHFWSFFGHFRPFFGPFLALFIYKGMCWLGVIPPLTLSSTAFEPFGGARSSWARWKALVKGFPIEYSMY